jgi:hypothetical protein
MIKLKTQERIVVACLTYATKPILAKTIAEQCNLLDYPYNELLKMMSRRNLLLERKNLFNGNLSYELNPKMLENIEK